jgi:hypothetical protein
MQQPDHPIGIGYCPKCCKREQYRAQAAAWISQKAAKEGKTLAEVKAMKPADGFGVATNGFITANRFVETVYATVKPD